MSDTAPDTAFPMDMTWRQLEGLFALVGFPEPAEGRDVELVLGARGGQIIREGGETTLLFPMQDLAEVLELHPGARVERDLCWYRFEEAMGWEVVGFLALVTARLAEAKVPVCAICAFSRDYVLIANQYEAAVERVLGQLFPRVG